jgi:hypothetical protein
MSPEIPGRFRQQQDTRDRDRRIPRARRYLGKGELDIAVGKRPFERWAYLDYPELIELRIRLPDVVIRIEGWKVTEEELLLAATSLERMTLGSDLLQRMRAAEATARVAWESWTRETADPTET